MPVHWQHYRGISFYCRDYELHWEQKRPQVKHQSLESWKMLLHTSIHAKWFFFLTVNLTVFDILTRWTHKNLFASDYTWALKPYSVEILAKTTVWHHCKPPTQLTTTLPSSPFLCLFYKRSWSCKPWRRGESLHWEAQWIPKPAKHAWTTETLLPTLSEEQWQCWCVFLKDRNVKEWKGGEGQRAYKRVIKSFQKEG